MKAIGYTTAGPITESQTFIEFDTPIPELGVNDLLVEVKAVSVNPVDTKVRRRTQPDPGPAILGYDAAGMVVKVGNGVTMFKPGDEVYYAGDITRPGTNAQFHLVDQRIVGHKPKSLDFALAAGIPLTAITAWELLFDNLKLQQGKHQDQSILVVGGAGGVGSILIQLAKQLTGLMVIATASRPETVSWVQQMGADHVINHHDSMVAQLAELGLAPNYVAALNGTSSHFNSLAELVAPRGHIAIIDDPGPVDISVGKRKALTFSWEFMFARPMFQTEDMIVQHHLLNRVAEMLDAGTLQSTVNTNLGPLTPASLHKAHQLQEAGQVIGKQVLEGLQ